MLDQHFELIVAGAAICTLQLTHNQLIRKAVIDTEQGRERARKYWWQVRNGHKSRSGKRIRPFALRGSGPHVGRVKRGESEVKRRVTLRKSEVTSI